MPLLLAIGQLSQLEAADFQYICGPFMGLCKGAKCVTEKAQERTLKGQTKG